MRQNINSVFGILKDVTGVVWQKPERVKLGANQPLIVLNTEMRLIKINTDNPFWVNIINQTSDHDETACRIGLIDAIVKTDSLRADINLDILNSIQPYLNQRYDDAESELRLKQLEEKQEEFKTELEPEIKTPEDIRNVHTKKVKTGRLYFHIKCPYCELEEDPFTPATFNALKKDFEELRTWWISCDGRDRSNATDEIGDKFPENVLTDSVLTCDYDEAELSKRWNTFQKYRVYYYQLFDRKLGWTNEMKDELFEMFENDTKNLATLAKRYRTSKETIEKILSERGTTKSNKKIRKRVIDRFYELNELTHNGVRDYWKRKFIGKLPKKSDSSQKLIIDILCTEIKIAGKTDEQVRTNVSNWVRRELIPS